MRKLVFCVICAMCVISLFAEVRGLKDYDKADLANMPYCIRVLNKDTIEHKESIEVFRDVAVEKWQQIYGEDISKLPLDSIVRLEVK